MNSSTFGDLTVVIRGLILFSGEVGRLVRTHTEETPCVDYFAGDSKIS